MVIKEFAMLKTQASVLAVSGLTLAVLSGCSNQNGSDETSETTYYCGAQTVIASSNDDYLTLQVGGNEYQLRSSSAASGARYVSRDDEDTEVVFWSRGQSAQLEIDGQTYPECRQAGTLSEETVARGNEPFWTLTIHESQMVLNRMGDDEVEYRIGDTEHENRQTRIHDTSERLQVTISEQLCQDSMSGMYFPQHAEVELDGETLQGCAGDSIQLLQGVEWRVEGLDDADYREHEVTLRFDHEQEQPQVVGRAACNRYFGSYELSGERLTMGQLAGTKMACPDDSMRVEYQFLDALSKTTGFRAERDDDDTLRLELTTDEGTLRLRQR